MGVAILRDEQTPEGESSVANVMRWGRINLIQQQRRQRGNRHHREIPMLHVSDLMGEYRVDFFRRQHIEQAFGDYNPRVAQRVAK